MINRVKQTRIAAPPMTAVSTTLELVMVIDEPGERDDDEVGVAGEVDDIEPDSGREFG